MEYTHDIDCMKHDIWQEGGWGAGLLCAPRRWEATVAVRTPLAWVYGRTGWAPVRSEMSFL